jgi:hypothetical protein
VYIINSAPPAAGINILPVAAQSNVFQIASGEPSAGTQCNLNLPGSNRLNGIPFVVRAAGYVSLPPQSVTTAATPMTFSLCAAQGSFVAQSSNAQNSTVVGAFTNIASTAKTIFWSIEATLMGVTSQAAPAAFGGTTGNMNGQAQSFNIDPNGVQVTGARTNISNPTFFNNINMASDLASAPPAQFAVLISTSSNANLTGTAFLSQFQIES